MQPTGSRRHLRIAGLALAVMLITTMTPALASVFIKEDMSSLAHSSEAVVVGRVVAMDSAWNEERTMIFTQVTLQVNRRLQGEAADEVVIRVPGGTVDGFTAVMSGAPEFHMGQHVMTFLARWDDGALMVNGYFQGLSQARQDKAGNLMLTGGVADGRSMSSVVHELRRPER